VFESIFIGCPDQRSQSRQQTAAQTPTITIAQMRSAAALLGTLTLCAHVASLQPPVWQKRHPHGNQINGMGQPQFGQHVIARPLHAITALSAVAGAAVPACQALESAAAVDSAPSESTFAFVGSAWFIFSVLAGIKGIGDKIQEAAEEKEKAAANSSASVSDDEMSG
jgi:hypothetical protein